MAALVRGQLAIQKDNPLTAGLAYAVLGNGKNLGYGGDATYFHGEGTNDVPFMRMDNPWGLPQWAMNQPDNSNGGAFGIGKGNSHNLGANVNATLSYFTAVMGIYPTGDDPAGDGTLIGVPPTEGGFPTFNNAIGRMFLFYRQSDGKLGLKGSYFTSFWDVDTRTASAVSVLDLNRWYTVGVRKGGSVQTGFVNNAIDFFTDGDKVGTTQSTGTANGGPVYPFFGFGATARCYIGSQTTDNATNRPMPGQIAFMYVWTRPLTDDDIKQVMLNPAALVSPDSRWGTPYVVSTSQNINVTAFSNNSVNNFGTINLVGGETEFDVTGHANTNAFGTPEITGITQINVTGHANTNAFGLPSIPQWQSIDLTGFADANAFGTLSLGGTSELDLTGFANTNAFGTIDIRSATLIELTALASSNAFGDIEITPGAVTLSVTAIASNNRFGHPQFEGAMETTLESIVFKAERPYVITLKISETL